ncbi:hypothetical protein QO034_05695 [Sedimentitalea sp. JM2-8]|uniref:PAS domain-containing protein n=1 Tax=Sedimentitalea xiamensis TaxID=3050037 RepID=A0ABT7FBV8_9RHOB|nr:hypothetical protein [Sedimentitalea xiamensis]MDK3072596.1 hypothetical protein [Sedimentitalea xiamensis]
MKKVRSEFTEVGAPAPLVLWSPDLDLMENGIFRRFADTCDRLSQGDIAIPAGALDLNAFGGMKDWMILLSRLPDGENFYYDHYGRGIARVYGQDMAGRSTQDFPGYIGNFFSVIYQAVIKQKRRVLTVHRPPNRVFVSTWRRLIVPVTSDDGEVVRILVLNTPENELRAGLEILPVPVLIVDTDHIVCYANKQACQAFDGGSHGPWNRSVFDYAALDLQIKESPAQILEHGIVQTSRCRHIKHTQIGCYEATISATLHHDIAFYVVLLQPQTNH